MLRFYILYLYILYLYTIYLGKPTIFAPIPRPAPDLAFTPIAGTYVSNMLNVHAAVSEIITISSTFRERWGIANAAIATIKPSIKYFTARFTS